jgi:hypothetical protein
MSDRISMTVAMPVCRRAERPYGLAVHVSPRTCSILETGQNAGAACVLTTASRGAAEKQCDAVN